LEGKRCRGQMEIVRVRWEGVQCIPVKDGELPGLTELVDQAVPT